MADWQQQQWWGPTSASSAEPNWYSVDNSVEPEGSLAVGLALWLAEPDGGGGEVYELGQPDELDHFEAEYGSGESADAHGRTYAAPMASNENPVTVGERFSIKVPPTWDGTRSYYGYECDVMECTGMTTIDPEQRGPLLNAKIVGHQLFIKEHIKEDQKKLHAGRKVEKEEKKEKKHFVRGGGILGSLKFPRCS